MRTLTITTVGRTTIHITTTKTIIYTSLRQVPNALAKSRVEVWGDTGRLFEYDCLETVDQIAEMLTEPPQSSPTDADIDRRVALLREATVFHELPFTTPRDYCTVDGKFYRRHWAESARTEWRETDEATFAAGLRATAIRELLRERGGK